MVNLITLRGEIAIESPMSVSILFFCSQRSCRARIVVLSRHEKNHVRRFEAQRRRPTKHKIQRNTRYNEISSIKCDKSKRLQRSLSTKCHLFYSSSFPKFFFASSHFDNWQEWKLLKLLTTFLIMDLNLRLWRLSKQRLNQVHLSKSQDFGIALFSQKLHSNRTNNWHWWRIKWIIDVWEPKFYCSGHGSRWNSIFCPFQLLF